MDSGWGSLPEELVRRIAACLPVDARLAAACTCSGWREALRCSGAWSSLLDLSSDSGVTAPVTEALLRAASMRARGVLRTLDVRGRSLAVLPLQAVRAVLWANSGALACARLQGDAWLTAADVEALLHAGGAQLTAVHADVFVWLPSQQNAQDVLALVATGRLVLHGLFLRGSEHMDAACMDNAAALLRALAAGPDARVRVQLQELHLENNATAAQRAALLDALQSLSGVREFGAQNCDLRSDALPAVSGAATGSLRKLTVCDEPGLLQGAGALDALGALLAANARTLECLTLRGVCAEGASAGGLVRTVCGGAALPALKELRLSGNGRHPDQYEEDTDDEAEEAEEEEEDEEDDSDSTYDDDSSSEEADAGDAAPPVGAAAPPVGQEADCGEACAALLARSRALTLLALPWLLTASLSPMLPSLRECRALTRLELQVRDVSDDWLRLRLFPALQPRPLKLELEAHDAFRMYASSASEQDRRLRDAADEAEYRRGGRYKVAKPAWDDWPCALLRGEVNADAPKTDTFTQRAPPRGDDDGYCSDSFDESAYYKAMGVWRERRECALREPRSRQRPWQLGSRDFGALPARVIADIWSRLSLRDRIACLGVCRAWRTGFAPPNAFVSLQPPPDVDGRLLRTLTPLYASLELFGAADCTEHDLELEDIEAFLWCTAGRRTLTAALPAFTRACTLEQVAALQRISKGATILLASVTAGSGAKLLACPSNGVATRSLELHSHDDAAAWSSDNLLACIESFCTRAARNWYSYSAVEPPQRRRR
jgi:hypothetical protein